MNLKKGILRIVVLVLWLIFWIGYVYLMLDLTESLNAENLMGLLTMFEAGFYLPVFVIVRMNSACPLREQVFDSEGLSFKLFLIISAIAGIIGFALYSHIESYGTHIAPYMGSFLAPFMLVFGSYIYVCWIVQGFQITK